MDAEPQVESLMQLLNDALNELDHLDKRLTGYDKLLRVSKYYVTLMGCHCLLISADIDIDKQEPPLSVPIKEQFSETVA